MSTDDLRALREFEGAGLPATERDRPARMTTTMPAAVVTLLRGALYAELRRSCEDSPAAMPESHTRAGWTPMLRRLNGALSGLNVVGWVTPSEQRSVTIALDAALIEVLEDDAEQWDWLSEQERTESVEGRARAAEHAATIERFLASLSERPEPATLLIPGPLLGAIREGVDDGLSVVSQAIDHGADPRECCRRLSAICDLLDLIEGSGDDEPASDVDATGHARTVAELAALMLPTLATAVRDLDDADPSKAGAEAELCLMRQLDTEASRTAEG
jgi:hypothetical protein